MAVSLRALVCVAMTLTACGCSTSRGVIDETKASESRNYCKTIFAELTSDASNRDISPSEIPNETDVVFLLKTQAYRDACCNNVYEAIKKDRDVYRITAAGCKADHDTYDKLISRQITFGAAYGELAKNDDTQSRRLKDLAEARRSKGEVGSAGDGPSFWDLVLFAAIAGASNPPPPGSYAAGPNQKAYNASQCIGAVVNGVCNGSIMPDAGYHPTCYGTMLNGQCTGPFF